MLAVTDPARGAKFGLLERTEVARSGGADAEDVRRAPLEYGAGDGTPSDTFPVEAGGLRENTGIVAGEMVVKTVEETSGEAVVGCDDDIVVVEPGLALFALGGERDKEILETQEVGGSGSPAVVGELIRAAKVVLGLLVAVMDDD